MILKILILISIFQSCICVSSIVHGSPEAMKDGNLPVLVKISTPIESTSDMVFTTDNILYTTDDQTTQDTASTTIDSTTANLTSATVVSTTAISTSSTVVSTTQIPSNTTVVSTTLIPTSTPVLSTTKIPSNTTVVSTEIPSNATEVSTTEIPSNTTVSTTLIPTSTTVVSTTKVPSNTTVVSTTEIPPSATVVSTTPIPTVTTVLSTTEISSNTTLVSTTEIPSNTTVVSTIEIPSSVTIVSTTEIPSNATVVSTTEITSNTTVVSTTEITSNATVVSTTEIPSNATEVSTTEIQSNATVVSTTDIPLNTTVISTTEIPSNATVVSTTEIPSNATVVSTTEIPSNATVVSTTEIPSNATVGSTTEIPSNATVVSTTEIPSNATVVSTSEIPSKTTIISTTPISTGTTVLSTTEIPSNATVVSTTITTGQATNTTFVSPTTTSAHPTTPAPPPDAQPPDWDSKYFEIALSVKYYLETDDIPEDEEAKIEQEIRISLLAAYFPSSGIGFADITILHSCTNVEICSESQRHKRSNNNDRYMVTNYKALYKMETVLTGGVNASVITSFITEDVITTLNETGVGGRNVDNEYTERVVLPELDKQGLELEKSIKNPCDFEESLCNDGLFCDNNSTDNKYCKPICYDGTNFSTDGYICCGERSEGVPKDCAAENEECKVTGQDSLNDYLCSCKEGYMYFGTFNCADQTIVIASLSAIIGVVILALLISTIVLSVKMCNSSGSQLNKYEMKQGLLKQNTIPMNDYDIEDAGSVGLDNKSYSDTFGNQKKGPQLDAFDFPMKEHVSKETDHSISNNSHRQTKQPRYAAHQYKDTPFEELYSDIAQSEAYQNFKPQLDHIDTSTDYFAKRPAINIKQKSSPYGYDS